MNYPQAGIENPKTSMIILVVQAGSPRVGRVSKQRPVI